MLKKLGIPHKGKNTRNSTKKEGHGRFRRSHKAFQPEFGAYQGLERVLKSPSNPQNCRKTENILEKQGTKNAHELFLHKLFEHRQRSGTSRQNSRDIPEYSSLRNPRKTNFRGRARTFRPPLRVEDPHPTGRSPDPKRKSLCSFFLHEKGHSYFRCQTLVGSKPWGVARQTKPKKGQFASRFANSGCFCEFGEFFLAKKKNSQIRWSSRIWGVFVNSPCFFLRKNTPNSVSHKNTPNSRTGLRIGPSLVWFAGATPEKIAARNRNR